MRNSKKDRKMITAEDISKATGISRSTVSAVFSGTAKKRRISEKTVAKILETAKELGYRPNAAARNLRRGKSNSIGILIPAPTDNAYSTLVRDLNRCISNAGYFALFAFWASCREQGLAAENILSHQPEGIITVEPKHLPEENLIPAVSLLEEDPRFDCVTFDREGIIRDAIAYLYDLGHRRIANPAFGETNIFPSVETACMEEFLARNLSREYLGGAASSGPNDYEHVSAVAEKIVSWFLAFPKERRPTAMILFSDLQTAHVIQKLEKKGISVPRDLSIVSCDNVPFAEVFPTPLTTFGDDPGKPLAKTLTEQLFFRMKHPDAPREIIRLKRKLYIRESARPLP